MNTPQIPSAIDATLQDGRPKAWAETYHAFTEEERRGMTSIAHEAINRVAREWIETNAIRVSVLETNICITLEPLDGQDGDAVLEFEAPLADVIMTAPYWCDTYAAPLAVLLRQLADKLEATSDNG